MRHLAFLFKKNKIGGNRMTQLTKKESMTSLELLKEINIFREKEGKETENYNPRT